MHTIKLKRVYESVEKTDGYRILVDRLWPRGVKKEELLYDWWPKDITPSPDSRKAFAHQAENFAAFEMAYRAELEANDFSTEFVDHIRKELESQTVTFIYAAKDPKINHVVLLKEWTETQLKK
ncbi:DUF488 family protein [Aerococcaceae bacterium DSM 109653]|uniref:DUF488 family protein n=1 Tax=Fundicoccus ignavus TaxID=2664442 RepID=A0A844BWX5_9LACT|nr:DUF488 family protein [Fundicoccus ignavus]MRI82413.1 DUF488 family protein [Fundicoccus ignavus]